MLGKGLPPDETFPPGASGCIPPFPHDGITGFHPVAAVLGAGRVICDHSRSLRGYGRQRILFLNTK